MYFVAALVTYNVFAVCFRPFWNRCLPKCLNKDSMLLCNCKEKIKKFSTAFAIALMSARLEQTVCYAVAVFFSAVSLNTAFVYANNISYILNRVYYNSFS